MNPKKAIAKSISDNYVQKEEILSAVLNHSAKQQNPPRIKNFRTVLAAAIAVTVMVAATIVTVAVMSRSVTFSLNADYATKCQEDYVYVTAETQNMGTFKDGIYGFTVDVKFDNTRLDFDAAYETVGAKLESGAEGFKIMTNNSISVPDTVTVLFYANDDTAPLSYLPATGKIFTLRFKVKSDADFGSVTFTPENCKVADAGNEEDNEDNFVLANVTPQAATVTIAAQAVTAIEITQPTNKVYTYPNNTFDGTGMTITAKYNNGLNGVQNTGVVTEDYTVSAIAWTYASQDLTVTYRGKTATITGITTQKGTLTEPTATAVDYDPELTLDDIPLTPSDKWEWNAPTTEIDCTNSNTTYQANYIGNDVGNYTNETVNVTITVNKIDPAMPTVAPVRWTSGMLLSAFTLPDGWTWDAPTTAITTVGTASYPASYAGNDNYNAKSAVSVSVMATDKDVPAITTNPAGTAITYGQSLNDSTLSSGVASFNGTPVEGTFAWTAPDTNPAAGTTTEYEVTFTPNDTANYSTTTCMVAITVNKATITVTPNASQTKVYNGTANYATLTYANSGAVLSQTPSFTGALAYDGGENAGDHAITLGTLALADSGTFKASNYNLVLSSTEVKFTITKATPTITANPSGTAITYGQALSDSTLSGGAASTAGAFTWTTAATKPNAGTANYSVTFTPSDTTNYDVKTFEISLTVNKATITVTPDSGKTKVYGEADPELTYTKTNAVSGETPAFEGALSYTGTNAGAHPITLGTLALKDNGTFKASNYNLVLSSTEVNFTITKANPVITTWPTGTAITYGAALSTSTLSGGASTPAGTFAWTDGAAIPAVTNSGYEVTFTPTDTTNYNAATQTVAITVNPNPNPTYTLPVIEPVTLKDGLKLSDITLPAGWSWTTPGTTELTEAKSYTYLAKFTPTDANYTAKDNIEITFTVAPFPAFDKTVTAGGDNGLAITVEAPAGVIPENTTVTADEVKVSDLNQSVPANLAEKLGEDAKFLSVIDIQLLDSEENPIATDGAMTMKIKLKDGWAGKSLKVVGIDEDGKLIVIDTTVENGYAVFTASGVGYYGLVELAENTGGTSETASEATGSASGSTSDTNDAKTGTDSMPILFVIIAFCGAAVLIVVAMKRKAVK